MRTHMLWDNGNGTAAVWRLDPSGSETVGEAVQRQFGPFGGWTARALAVGPDGLVSLLWTGRDRAVSLWSVDMDDGDTRHWEFGPYTGWDAVGLGIGPDNVLRVLWAGANGTASLWSVRDGAPPESLNCGPVAGAAAALAVGADNRVHLLWRLNEGKAGVWCIGTDGWADQTEYGAPGGWEAAAIAAGREGSGLLWKRTGGFASLWEIGGQDHAFAEDAPRQTVHGPFAGWTPVSVALNASDGAQFLWRYDGRGLASVWRTSAFGEWTHIEYGPYAGWVPVALATGP